MPPIALLSQPREDAVQHPGQSFWPRWSKHLRRFGLDAPVEALLESAGPLSLVLAQLIYLGQPFLNHSLPAGQAGAVARLLEDQSAAEQFAAFLREENGS